MGHLRPLCNKEAITTVSGAFVAILGNGSPVAHQNILRNVLKFAAQTSSFSILQLSDQVNSFYSVFDLHFKFFWIWYKSFVLILQRREFHSICLGHVFGHDAFSECRCYSKRYLKICLLDLFLMVRVFFVHKHNVPSNSIVKLCFSDNDLHDMSRNETWKVLQLTFRNRICCKVLGVSHRSQYLDNIYKPTEVWNQISLTSTFTSVTFITGPNRISQTNI